MFEQLSLGPRARRAIAVAFVAAVGAVIAVLALDRGSAHPRRARPLPAATTSHPTTSSNPSPVKRPAPRRAQLPYAIARQTIRLVDRSRRIQLPGGASEPRTLLTEVRYPAASTPQAVTPHPFPLIVFGHGYTLSPAPYSALLDAWTRAGYVVAAPVFPLENGNAPGGPNEADLVNQPADVSFVISNLLMRSASSRGVWRGLIDPRKIAVAGHSDGGETALAVAYDRFYRDRRVDAAVILSGAKIPGAGGFNFAPGSPPLLATQGTADTINPPSFTFDFYNVARPPKYLLQLLGANHLGPYTQQPQLGIVERVTIAFLDRYLKRRAVHLDALGNVPGLATLSEQR